MNAKEINKSNINHSTNQKPAITQIKTPTSTPIKLDNYLKEKYSNLNISKKKSRSN